MRTDLSILWVASLFEHLRDCVNSISQSKQLAFNSPRNCVLYCGRRVLVINSRCHDLSETLSLCIKATDNPLEFGKFLHQFGGEIGLRQFDRLEGATLSTFAPLFSVNRPSSCAIARLPDVFQ